jgi:hypothetical protein
VEATPASGVEAENVFKVGTLFDPIVQHFCEGGAFMGVTSRKSNITELVDDFDAVFEGLLVDLLSMDCDQAVSGKS